MLGTVRPGFVALALLLPLSAALTVTSLPAAHAAPGAPAAVKTLRTDVDGDGRQDGVQLFDLGSDTYRLTVTTSKAATSSVDFTAKLLDGMTASDALYGVVPIDGVRGSELVVKLWDRDAFPLSGRAVDLGVYTWRAGGLVAEKPPAATLVKGVWHIGEPWTRAQGYRFFDSHGRRYVDVSDLTEKSVPSWHWVGKITRSVWKNGAWVKVSTRNVSLSRVKAEPYLGYSGPSVLLGIAYADIDGDAVADELRYYRYLQSDNMRYKVKVTTATGKVVSKLLAADGLDPFLGAAEIDDVAGRELVFETFSEEPLWRVLAWRKGTLVYEPGPAMCGNAAGGLWMGCSDETIDNLTFSTVDGVRYVVAGELNRENNNRAAFDKSMRQAGKWVKVSSWVEFLTEEQVQAFPRGFTGVDFIKP